MLLPLLLLLVLPQADSGNNGFQIKRNKQRPPKNVTFSSVNFKTKLTWLAPKRSEGVRYTVEYIKYGDGIWKKKLECTNITWTWCDLTNETSNYNARYFGMVTACNQSCSVTKQSDIFDPKQQTKLGPLTVILFYNDTSIIINLKHPVESLHRIYKTLKYYIYINGIAIQEIEVPYYTIEPLYFNTTYCVTAKVSGFEAESVVSNKTCITTKPDPTSEEIIKVVVYILIVLLVIFIVFAAGYGVHKYIHVSNLMQPRILNITANNNNNAVLVEGHTVTINFITIDSGMLNLQNTMMSDKEKAQNNSKLYFSDGGDEISHDSGVVEEADHGYVSLQEQAPATRPQLSPYDMPNHVFGEPARPHEPAQQTASSDFVHLEQDLYAQINFNSNIAQLQEKEDLEVIQNAYMSEKTLVNYLPKNDGFPKFDEFKKDLCEVEESFTGQDSDDVDVTSDTDLSECGSLFVDWSPTSPHLCIPKLCNKAMDEFHTEECQEVKEGLLSQLYIPRQSEETSKEDDVLVQLQERWGLLVQMQE